MAPLYGTRYYSRCMTHVAERAIVDRVFGHLVRRSRFLGFEIILRSFYVEFLNKERVFIETRCYLHVYGVSNTSVTSISIFTIWNRFILEFVINEVLG